MLTPSFGLVLLASAGLAECRSVLEARHIHGHLGHKRQNNDLTATILAANAIQNGSSADGSGVASAAAGQAKSDTSQNNFINICAGKTLTNGLQVTGGSCNGIPMGEIPSKSNMVSSIITFPIAGSKDIESETTFSINVQISNFVPGSFTNAKSTYYSAPQALSGGKIVGHTHVTVQNMGASLNPTQPLDATRFVFFKGINDVGNGQGLLSATVTGGLPAGNYRVCTMASSSNHQAVLMPVAQRGAQDDCTKFTVVQSKNASSSSGGGSTASSSSVAGSSVVVSLTSKAAALSTKAPFTNSTIAATTTSKAGNGGKGGKGNGNGGGKGGNGGKGATTKVQATTAKDSNQNGNGNNATPPAQAATTKSAKSNNAGGDAVISDKLTNNNGGGKAIATPAAGAKATKTVVEIVHKVTIIETFFEFVLSLGGLPPSVGKNGNSFAVLDELFDDLTSACVAACGHQYTTCISFTGAGFSFEECKSQQNSCGSAASTASAVVPATLTATVTVPPTATITGKVISESTLSTTVKVAPTSAPIASGAAPAQATDIASSVKSSAACSIVTATVTVDAPNIKATSSPLPTVISQPKFSNSTASATLSAPASTSSVSATGSGSAVGGIAAPAVTSSGDSTRPFAVNGNTFVNEAVAVQRSCDIQFNKCADAVNGGKLSTVSVGDCTSQKDSCGK